MVLTALVTLWIPETKNVSIAEIEKGVLYGERVRSDSDEVRSDETEISTVKDHEQGLEDRKSVIESV